MRSSKARSLTHSLTHRARCSGPCSTCRSPPPTRSCGRVDIPPPPPPKPKSEARVRIVIVGAMHGLHRLLPSPSSLRFRARAAFRTHSSGCPLPSRHCKGAGIGRPGTRPRQGGSRFAPGDPPDSRRTSTSRMRGRRRGHFAAVVSRVRASCAGQRGRWRVEPTPRRLVIQLRWTARPVNARARGRVD